jgi:hypothetical protein
LLELTLESIVADLVVHHSDEAAVGLEVRDEVDDFLYSTLDCPIEAVKIRLKVEHLVVEALLDKCPESKGVLGLAVDVVLELHVE